MPPASAMGGGLLGGRLGARALGPRVLGHRSAVRALAAAALLPLRQAPGIAWHLVGDARRGGAGALDVGRRRRRDLAQAFLSIAGPPIGRGRPGDLGDQVGCRMAAPGRLIDAHYVSPADGGHGGRRMRLVLAAFAECNNRRSKGKSADLAPRSAVNRRRGAERSPAASAGGCGRSNLRQPSDEPRKSARRRALETRRLEGPPPAGRLPPQTRRPRLATGTNGIRQARRDGRYFAAAWVHKGRRRRYRYVFCAAPSRPDGE